MPIVSAVRPIALPVIPTPVSFLPAATSATQPSAWQPDTFQATTLPTMPLPFSAGNDVQLVIGDEATYQKALQFIAQAKYSIQFETFTFNAEQGQGIAQALVQARKRGVNVQVILDSKSMFIHNQRRLAKDMHRQGIEVRVYQERHLNHPVIAIDHTKLLLIDGQKALAGGTNFDRRINYDVNFEISGPAIPVLAKIFTESRKNSKLLDKPTQPVGVPLPHPVPAPVGGPQPNGRTHIGLTRTLPKHEAPSGPQTLPYALAAIQKAKHSIDLMMYKMADQEELNALAAAQARGVKVRVILNRDSFNQNAVYQLQRAGIVVQWYQPPQGVDELHTKVAIFDRQTVLGGSTNWVHASNYDNHELGLWLQGDGVDDICNLFEQQWQQQSSPAGPLSARDRIKAWVIDHLDWLI